MRVRIICFCVEITASVRYIFCFIYQYVGFGFIKTFSTFGSLF